MKNMTITRPVQYASVSTGAEACLKRHSVLAGHRSCDWYDQQEELGPITLRKSLVLYTQLNVPSVILVCWFSSFDPLNKMILLSWAVSVWCMWGGVAYTVFTYAV